jgi:putative tryptophan/tyrosine transport system substrate-binding protein
MTVRRRNFITLVGGAAAWSFAARAQQATMPVIGFLNPVSRDLEADILQAFRQGLAQTGYVEGRNLAIEYRWAEGRNERLPEFAADLVHLRVAVIVTGGLPAARAAKAATTTIPIVFTVGVDPVAFGLVASLNHPGGNLTGMTGMSDELGPKRLELLHELAPAATNIGLLVNPTNPNSETQSRNVQAAARTLGLKLHVLQASSERDLDAAFAGLAELGAGGLVISSDRLFIDRSEQLAALAIGHAVPTIFQTRAFTASGGLASYGAGVGTIGIGLAMTAPIGVYTGRILKGEKPADLPVQQPTKFGLAINLKTAKALGLTVPPTMLALADEVIE